MTLESNGLLQGLYANYHQVLIQYAVTRTGVSENEAEDVVQNTFLKLSKTGVDSVSNHRAYLYKTAFNLSVDSRKRSNARLEADGHEDVDELGPETVAADQEDLEIILEALSLMPAKRRLLLIMHRFDELSYAEIARREGLSETVVRKQIARSLADFQKTLRRDI